ncbi:MAG: ComEC/Rec2 family competence protein [Candidatus Saccharibacteria bacterium]|nr:ComEC/Rec2 family competence protein [Candidatus Saccharibacteria bacterium]
MTIISDQKSLASYYGRDVTISGVLLDDAENKDSQTRLRIGSLHINNSINTLDCQVYVMLPERHDDIERSDSVTLRGVLGDGFGEYDGFMYQPELISLGKPSPPDIANQIKHTFSNNIRSLFDEDISNLALGYLVGDKSNMSDIFIQKLRLAGLSHLVVTSGFHLSILIEIMKKILNKVSRAATIIGIVAVVTSFISVAGFSASMARASLMSLLGLAAWYFGRKFNPGRLFLYVVALTLIINPRNLTNVGWQLSFIAYFGIIFFAPVLMRFLYGSCKPNSFANALIVSISAQLFCLPISIYNFGMFSVAGIIVGLIISPTIALVMALTLLSGTFLPFLAVALEVVIRIHLFLIDYAASIPWVAIELPPGNILILLIYVPLLVFLVFIKRITRFSFRPRYALDKS